MTQILMTRAVFMTQKIDNMALFFRKYDLYDKTKMTELEHTTTVQRSITSENSHR